jgi:hypothetical protein
MIMSPEVTFEMLMANFFKKYEENLTPECRTGYQENREKTDQVDMGCRQSSPCRGVEK